MAVGESAVEDSAIEELVAEEADSSVSATAPVAEVSVFASRDTWGAEMFAAALPAGLEGADATPSLEGAWKAAGD